MVVTPWYPTMTSNNTSDVFQIFSYANSISSGILMPVMLLVIGMIALLGTVFSGKSVFRGLTYAGFITSILSILLAIMNMLNTNYMYLCFLLTGIGLIGVRLSEAPS